MCIRDRIQHVHWDGGNHHDLLRVIFENKDHVEVFQAELDTLKVDQLDIFQSDGKWRLESKWKPHYVLKYFTNN